MKTVKTNTIKATTTTNAADQRLRAFIRAHAQATVFNVTRKRFFTINGFDGYTAETVTAR